MSKIDLDALLDDLADRIADRVAERWKVRKAALPIEKAYLDTNQAADLLALTPGALGALRRRGKGPPFVRVGRLIRYSVAAVQQWLEEQG